MKHRITAAILCLTLSLLLLTGCTMKAETLYTADGNMNQSGSWLTRSTDYAGSASENMPMTEENTEEYAAIDENGFHAVALSPLSTFSADIDTAAYCNLRRMVREGFSPADIPTDAIRTEELLNYFTYDYAAPDDESPFGVTAVIGDCPWNEETKLLVLGLRTAEGSFEQAPPANLVFLIDVSGSMNQDDKLGLLKQAFSRLTENLRPEDTVSIVTYSGEERVVLEGASGGEPEAILNAVNGLTAGGSTDGEAGLSMAYRIAEAHYLPTGVNRIVLASDGDLNVGISSPEELKELVSEKRDSGVYLSVLGFGSGNYKDNRMEALAQNGNGNYHYIDCIEEAARVFGRDLCANMVPAADDVKLQVEFNPQKLKGYRLIGYENRMLEAEDFADDAKDAGEVGTGHCLTVAYELVPVSSEMPLGEEDLRYQTDTPTDAALGDEWLMLSVRYKEPGETESLLCAYPIGEDAYTAEPGADWRFASCVIELCMSLRESAYGEGLTIDRVLTDLDALELNEERAELRSLVALLSDR